MARWGLLVLVVGITGVGVVLRAERGWSQTDLADLLGVTRRTISSLEQERYDPSLPLAFRISRLFGQPIEAIFDDAEEQAAAR